MYSSRGRRPPPRARSRPGGRTFAVPDGFEVELVAGPPLVDRPIEADFDEQGRLYVTDVSGTNEDVNKQLADRPHRVLRLEDTDGDGRFDRRTVFADRMPFPEGAMWLDGSLYVAAPPSIWKLTDDDGDGVADRREEWFQGKTLGHCANDLHGPYRGPDGWVYWCKGAFAEQTYERPGKRPLVTRASHIFRCRPDGTGIEPVMTGGMDNPVDVAFTPGGERIFTTTFLVHPGGGLRDGLLHDVYGGVYGKVHAVLDGHPRTGPDVMPVMTHLGPAAPCGLARYESGAFGEAFRDNLFACCFNLHKVTRHVLDARGRHVRHPRLRTSSPPATTSTSTRPTSSRTPTAACSWSTPAAGTSSAARRRSSASRTCSARSTASGARGCPGSKTRGARLWDRGSGTSGNRCPTRSSSSCSATLGRRCSGM